MKLILVVLSLALAVLAEDSITNNYHEDFGIPEAKRIRLAEEAADFDGSRIIGGSASNVGAFPFMGGLVVRLTDGGQSMCGSSLLTNTKLVTAAHCWRTSTSQARDFTVVFASNRLFSGGTRIVTSNVQMHGSYNTQNLHNDVAIITISHVPFNNNINRILLQTGSNLFVGTTATAIGYGRTRDGEALHTGLGLRHVNLQVITNAVCASTFGSNVIIASTLCTSSDGGTRNICVGDSGGPLTVGSGSNRRLIGITSFGSFRGCQSSAPAAFARVTSFASWINARI